jgi:hypothetical protein
MALGPLPDVIGTVKLRFLWTWNSRPAVNVFYLFSGLTTYSLSDITSVATQVAAAATTNIKPLVHNSCLLNFVEATDLNSRTGLVGTVAGFGAGAKTGTSAPNSVAMCVSLPTPLRFRGGHWRMYLPGMASADINPPNSQWNAGTITAVLAGMRAFRTALNGISAGGATHSWVGVKYFTHDADHHPIYEPLPIRSYPITDTLVHTRIDSQRRRTGKELS